MLYINSVELYDCQIVVCIYCSAHNNFDTKRYWRYLVIAFSSCLLGSSLTIRIIIYEYKDKYD